MNDNEKNSRDVGGGGGAFFLYGLHARAHRF